MVIQVKCLKASFLLIMLGMAGNLNAAEVAPPVDNTVAPCDEDQATPRPGCDMDDSSMIVPPQIPGSEESVVEPPRPIEEGVPEDGPTSIPPPAPVPPKPKPPEEEPSGLIPPPQPKPQP